MILPDLNLLLYAYNSHVAEHELARLWWEQVMNSDELIALPQARVLTPSAGHFSRVMTLMEKAMARGSVLSDAVLASYAIEHRACLCTNDSDFARFPGLNWLNPLSTDRSRDFRL